MAKSDERIDLKKYIKNVGKSVAFISVNSLKEKSDSATSLIETNQELFANVYNNIKDYKNTIKRMQGAIKGSKVYEAAEVGIQSTIDSIKTGEFYSKKREDYYTSKALGSGWGGDDDFDLGLGDMDLGGGDSDDDFGFGDDWGDFDFDDDELDITDGDRMVSDKIESSSMVAAGAISETIAESAKYTAKVQKVSTNLLYTEGVLTRNNMNAGFSKVNEVMTDLANAQVEALKTMDQNNQTFYQSVLQLDKDRNEMLTKILELQQKALGITETKNKEKENLSFNGIIDTSGTPDFAKYLKAVKSNIMNNQYLSMINSASGLGGEDGNVLLTFAANPLSFIAEMAAKNLMPKVIDDALEGFNKSLGGVFGALISKFNYIAKNSEEESNPIVQAIAQVLGLKVDRKTSIDTKNYNKGPVPFDGITRKSIVEVIPFYLRQIASGVTGQEEISYDFDSGKFIKSFDIKRKFKDDSEGYIKTAMSDLKGEVNRLLEVARKETGLHWETRRDEENFQKDLDKIYEGIYRDDGHINTNMAKDELASRYGVSKASIDFFLKSIWPNIKGSIKLNMANNVISQKASQANKLRDLESKGDSIFTSYFNDSGKFSLHSYDSDNVLKVDSSKSMLISTVDNYGRNIFYYMQEMYRELIWQRINWGEASLSPTVDNIDPNRPNTINTRRKTIKFNQSGKKITDKPKDPKGIDSIYISRAENKAAKNKASREQSKDDDFNRKLEELIKKFPNGAELSMLSDDEKKLYNTLRGDIERGVAMEKYKESKVGFDRISQWYDDMSIYGNSGDAKERWEKLQDMVYKTPTLKEQLKNAETFRDKLGVIKIRSSNFKNDFVQHIADVITDADKALYKLVYGDEKYIDRDDPKSFMGTLSDRVTQLFEDIRAKIEFGIDRLKKKLGIDEFSDIFRKFAAAMGFDWDESIKSIKEKAKEMWDPIKKGIKDAFNGAWDTFKEAADAVGDATGINKLLQASEDKKKAAKDEADRAAKQAELEETFANAIYENGLIRNQEIERRNKNNLLKLDLLMKRFEEQEEADELMKLINDPTNSLTFQKLPKERQDFLNRAFNRDRIEYSSIDAVIGQLMKDKGLVTGDLPTKDLEKAKQLTASDFLDMSEKGAATNYWHQKYLLKLEKDKLSKEKKAQIEELLKQEGNENLARFINYFGAQGLDIDQILELYFDKSGRREFNIVEKWLRDSGGDFLRDDITGEAIPILGKRVFDSKEFYDTLKAEQEKYQPKNELEIGNKKYKTFSLKRQRIIKDLKKMGMNDLAEDIAENPSLYDIDAIANQYGIGDIKKVKAENLKADIASRAKNQSKVKEALDRAAEKQLKAQEKTVEVIESQNKESKSYYQTSVDLDRGRNKLLENLIKLQQLAMGIIPTRDNNDTLNRLFGALDNPNESNAANELRSILRGRNSNEPEQNAYGTKYVEKGGLTAISKGELIVPANLNPFNPDRDKVDINKQSREENRMIDRYTNSYKGIEKRASGSGNMGATTRVIEGKSDQPTERGFGRAMLDVVSGAFKSIGNALGFSDKKDDEQFKEAVNDMGKAIEKNLPNVLGGGLVGGLLSLVTGMVGGPLLGAAAGAAINTVAKSEKMNRYLFGEVVDENGGRAGGKLSKEMAALLPDLKNFALIGTVAGALTPLGAVGGLIAGSSIAYIKNNEQMMEALFGEASDPDSGLFSKNKRKWLEERLPEAAVGAVATMVLGPFGLVGNAALGAGLGLLTTTNEFQDAVFGPEHPGPGGEMVRTGGIVGAIKKAIVDPSIELFKEVKDNGLKWIKEQIIDPVAKAVNPIAKELKIIVHNMFETITNHINKMFSSILGNPLDVFLKEKVFEPITKLISGTVGRAVKPLGWVLSRPSAMIGSLGERLRAKQIKHGQADYMTAQQRLDYREENYKILGGRDKYVKTDEFLAGLESDQLKTVVGNLKEIYNNDSIRKNRRAAKLNSNELIRELSDNFDTSTKKKIQKALKNYQLGDDLTKVNKIIDGLDMDDMQKEAYKKQFADKFDSVAGKMRESHLYNDELEEMSKKLKKLGINVDLTNRKDIKKLIDYSEKEISARSLLKEPEQTQDEKVLTQFEKVIDILNTGNDKIVKGLQDINETLKNPPRERHKKDEEGKDEEPPSSVAEEVINEAADASQSVSNIINDAAEMLKKPKTETAADDDEPKEQKKKTISTLYGNIHQELDSKGNWVNCDDPETKETLRRRDEAEGTQRGILGKLSDIKGSMAGFFKNFFLGNKDTEMEPWWKTLLKGVAVGTAALNVLPFIGQGLNSLLQSMGIDVPGMTQAVKDAVMSKTINPSENGGLGMSGLYGEESVAGVASSAAIRAAYRNKFSFKHAVERTPFLHKSKLLTNMAEGADNFMAATRKAVPGVVEGGTKLADKVKTKVTGTNLYKKAVDVATGANSKENRLLLAMKKGTEETADNLKFKALQKMKYGKDTPLNVKDLLFAGPSKYDKEQKAVLMSTLKGAEGSATAKSRIINAITKVFERVSKRIPANARQGVTKFIKELGERLSKNAVVKGGKTMIKAGGKLLSISLLMPVDALFSFTSGYQEADSIYGVIEDSSITDSKGVPYTLSENMKVVAGIIRMANNILALGIIPEKVIFDMALKYIAPPLGFDTSEIEDWKQKSKAFVEDYNKEKGEDFSIEQYNKEVQGHMSIGTRIANSQVVASAKEAITNGFIPAVKNVAGKAFDFVKEFGPKAIDLVGYTVNVVASTIREISGSMKNEENDDKWKEAVKISDDDPLAPIKKVIFYGTRLLGLPIIAAMKMIKGLGGGIVNLISGTMNTLSGIGQDVGSMIDAAWLTDGTASSTLDSIIAQEPEDATGVGGFVRGFTKGIAGFVLLVPAAFHDAMSVISPAIDRFKKFMSSGVTSEEESKYQQLLSVKGKTTTEKLVELGKMMESGSSEGNQLLRGIWYMKSSFMILADGLLDSISDFAGNIFGTIKEKGIGIIEAFTGLDLGEYFDHDGADKPVNNESKEKKGFFSWRKVKDGYQAVTGTDGGASMDVGTGKYYQKDPKYAKKRYQATGDSVYQTIGDSGCGPSVASSMINKMTGKDIPIDQSAAYASARGYKAINDGTRPEFFGDYMSNYGVQANYYSSKDQAYNNIANGRPTILMGKDVYGTGSTPFGPHSHYVIATGVDKYGNMNIEDPERRGNKKYPARKVMNDTSIAIGAKKSKYGMGGSVDYATQNLGIWSPIDASTINAFIRRARPGGCGFTNKGSAFIEAGKKSGLDPRYILAHACLESGYGDSKICKDKHNCFGIGAFDSSPYQSAYTFKSIDDGIIAGAQWISDHYYKKGHTTLYKMHKAGYATDIEWAIKIANIMKSINDFSSNSKNTKFTSDDSVSPGVAALLSDPVERSSEGSSFWSKFDSGLAKIGAAVYGTAWGLATGFDDSDSYSGDSYGEPYNVPNPSGSADNWFLGNIVGGKVTSRYQAKEGIRGYKPHGGIDYSNGNNDPIYTPIDGTVVKNTFEKEGFGNYLVIKDSNGYKHYFGHMKNPSKLSVNTKVKRGDQIGIMGSTGHSSGNHLHYEIRDDNNNSMDPNKFFRDFGLGKADVNNTKIADTRVKQKSEESKLGKGGEDNRIMDTLIVLVKAIVEILQSVSGNTEKLAQAVEIIAKATGTELDIKSVQNSKNTSKDVSTALYKALASADRNMPINKSDDYTLSNKASFIINNLREIAAS